MAIFLGSLIGVILGLLRTVGPIPVRATIGGYVHMLRAFPFLIQIYVVYFVLPETGWEIFNLTENQAAVVALAIYTSSYATEIVRSALETVPKGQWEAAISVGMNLPKRLYYVIVPQAIKFMLPPLAGVYVLVIKGTSILTVIGVVELMREGEDAIHRHPAHIMLVLMLVATMYFAYCFPILRFIRYLEDRLEKVKT